MARHRGLPLVLLWALLGVSAGACAEPVEHTLEVPVALPRPDGSTLHRKVLLTVLQESSRQRAPWALLLHGRPVEATAFARMGRQIYPANSAWLLAQGFTVLIPTRIGYGLSGGPDIEFTGPCADKDPGPALASAVAEIGDILKAAARLPWVDGRRGVLIGESFGGLIGIAAAADRLPGLRGVIDFAGGDGGDFSHPRAPCGAERLDRALVGYGASSRLPVLWLYSANDLLWGEQWPRRWFEDWQHAGGRGAFIALPANGANGHFVFNHGPELWHPPVQAFLTHLGFGAHGRAP